MLTDMRIPTVEGAVYTRDTMRIDGHRYINCRFDNCVLEFAGLSPVGFEGCHLINVRWSFVGPAGTMIAFLNMVHNTFGEGGRAMIATINELIQSNPQSPLEAVSGAAISFDTNRPLPYDTAPASGTPS